MSSRTSGSANSKIRAARLQLRLSTGMKAKIRLAASLEGVPMSAFVLTHANEAAQRVLERESRIELGEEASVQVAEALTRPARALPELVDLFTKDRAELLAAVAHRTGIDEAEAQHVLTIIDAALALGWRPAAAAPQSAETVKEQYDRVPDIGQPFPAWADRLIDEIDVAPERRNYARDLLKRVMLTVGIDESAVRTFLFEPNEILKRSPADAIHERGWVALDALLRTMLVGPMP